MLVAFLERSSWHAQGACISSSLRRQHTPVTVSFEGRAPSAAGPCFSLPDVARAPHELPLLVPSATTSMLRRSLTRGQAATGVHP